MAKKSISPQRSDHWQEMPRYAGKFTTEQPTSKKPVIFRLSENLMEELEKVAGDRQTSVNLLIKDFVVSNFAKLLEVTPTSQP